MVNGEPYITPKGEEVIFRAQLGSIVAINVRYQVKDLLFAGKLEY
jgi:hypothetical protein